ncbi:unnamed protein product, partial [Rotaria sp. Silwood2]
MHLKPDHAGIVGLDALDNGKFGIEIYAASTNPRKLLHKFTITKDSNGVSVHNVDTNATVVAAKFSKADEPFVGAVVLGQFIDRSGEMCNIQGKTDGNGAFQIVLPEGTMKSLVAKSKEGIEIPKRGVIVVPNPSSSSTIGPRKPLSIAIDIDSKNFASALNNSSNDARVVVLGDVSDCKGKNKPVAFASWDSWVEWCCDSYITTDIQRTAAISWISSRMARGGNDMRFAIEEAMRKFPDAQD